MTKHSTGAGPQRQWPASLIEFVGELITRRARSVCLSAFAAQPRYDGRLETARLEEPAREGSSGGWVRLRRSRQRSGHKRKLMNFHVKSSGDEVGVFGADGNGRPGNGGDGWGSRTVERSG